MHFVHTYIVARRFSLKSSPKERLAGEVEIFCTCAYLTIPGQVSKWTLCVLPIYL